MPELEEGEESSDDDLGPDGWDDVLSAWMGSAGLPDVWSGAAAPPHAASTSPNQAAARHLSGMIQHESFPVPATTQNVDRQTPTPVRGGHTKPPVGPTSGRSSLEKKPVGPLPWSELHLVGVQVRSAMHWSSAWCPHLMATVVCRLVGTVTGCGLDRCSRRPYLNSCHSQCRWRNGL